MRPWTGWPIEDNGEPLLALPPSLLRVSPHPYQELGAPYGAGGGPFRLRADVVRRLLAAQEHLRQNRFDLRLLIFDAWRPVAVQRFMVRHSIEAECQRRGLDPQGQGEAVEQVRELVARFWAEPSEDPLRPPPHSTGAAVDLTLAGSDGLPLPMGGEIDALGPVSEPGHHAAAAAADPDSQAAIWHHNRECLAASLAAAGFVRHPNEWWHFSHGDQLWAWCSGAPAAVYGRREG